MTQILVGEKSLENRAQSPFPSKKIGLELQPSSLFQDSIVLMQQCIQDEMLKPEQQPTGNSKSPVSLILRRSAYNLACLFLCNTKTQTCIEIENNDQWEREP